jgi:hypothetical protein
MHLLINCIKDTDDHVGGVRLRLWTVAINGPIVHPQVIYEHAELWRNEIDSGKLLIHPPELSRNLTNRVI